MPRPISASTARAGSCLSRQWVFGYGSLVHVEDLTHFLASHGLELGDYRYDQLSGFRRSWSVAMDNAQRLPGYKCYVDAATDEHLAVYVAFANIERESEASVRGILFEVDERALAVLDDRERSYHRTEVTQHIGTDVEGTVWTYVGRPDAHARYHEGLSKRTLVLDKAYVECIEAAFAIAGLPYEPELPRDVPLMSLKRIDT